jgi:hypothetical protein
MPDDLGSRLWIDDKAVIDNDGRHAIRVWFCLGPATELALQL